MTVGFGSRTPPDPQDDVQVRTTTLGAVDCAVLRAGWYRFPPAWGFEHRVLPNAIVYVVVGGRMHLLANDVQRWLVSGDVLLTAPESCHSLRNDPLDPAEFYTVHFLAHAYGILDAVSLYGFPSLLEPGLAEFEAIRQIAANIFMEFHTAGPGCTLMAKAACCKMLGLLWREAVRSNPETPNAAQTDSPQLTRLAPVFATIQARYAEPLTLRELAAVVHLEPAYFSTLFKRVTGMSPFRYLGNYRLRRARQLLLATDSSMAEIALATGFRDPFYLSRVFKKAEGVSPREYRRTQHGPGSP